MTRVTGSVALLAVVTGSVVIALVSTSSSDAQGQAPVPMDDEEKVSLKVAAPIAAEPVAQRQEIPERIPAVDDSEQATRDAVRRPVTATFKDVAALDALRQLGELAEVSIRLAPNIANQDELDLTQPVSGDFKDVPLVTVVEQLIGSLPDLSYEGRSALTLYPADAMELELNVRAELAAPYGVSRHVKKTYIYPVSDICSDHADAEELMDVLRTSCGQYWIEEGPDGRQGIRMLGQLMTMKDDDDIYPVLQSADTMKYLNSVRGLVITAKAGTHDEVLKMLRMVREAHRASQLAN